MDPNLQTLQGFRVALALGQRNGQVWAMRELAGSSLQEVGDLFAIGRERVRQLVKRANGILESWPEPNAWQATLAPRLRELAALHDLASAQELADAVARMRGGGKRLRGFDDADVAAATALVRAQLETWRVGEEVAKVLATTQGIAGALSWLESQDVVGAALIRKGLDLMRRDGVRVYTAITKAEADAAKYPED